MKKIDLVPAILWCAGGIAVLTISIRLGLGTLRAPGPGLFPFILGVLLACVSLPIIGGALRAAEFGEWRFKIMKPAIIVAAMLVYALVLNTFGFLITTFCFILLLLRTIDTRSWRLSLAFSASVAFVANVVFVNFLQVELPSGFILHWVH